MEMKQMTLDGQSGKLDVVNRNLEIMMSEFESTKVLFIVILDT